MKVNPLPIRWPPNKGTLSSFSDDKPTLPNVYNALELWYNPELSRIYSSCPFILFSSFQIYRHNLGRITLDISSCLFCVIYRQSTKIMVRSWRCSGEALVNFKTKQQLLPNTSTRQDRDKVNQVVVISGNFYFSSLQDTGRPAPVDNGSSAPDFSLIMIVDLMLRILDLTMWGWN